MCGGRYSKCEYYYRIALKTYSTNVHSPRIYGSVRSCEKELHKMIPACVPGTADVNRLLDAQHRMSHVRDVIWRHYAIIRAFPEFSRCL